MRIALVHDGGTLDLAGSRDYTLREFPGADNLRFEGRTALQADARVRAAATSHIDRGNLATTVSFGTSRIFSTTAAAEVWSGMYDTVSARSGTLVISDWDLIPLLNFPGAVVQPPRRQVIGCTVLLQYEVVCGAPVQPTQATGSVELVSPLAGDTLNIFGTVFTASDAGSPAAPLWNKTAAGLAAAINSVAGGIASWMTAAADGDTVLLTCDIYGETGNDITLATNAPARVVLSAATLTGGVGITTQIPLW
jgi:hypothetical protein